MDRARRSVQCSAGFTLVETLIVLVVLAVAATAIASLQFNMFRNQSAVSTVQVSTQLQLECAEQILAIRRSYPDWATTITSPSASYTTNACGDVTALGSYSVPTVIITAPYNGAACPNTDNCRLVEISQAGNASLTFMLVDY
jgi:prepilin-type N-terminal cleavage/methylation domain-containing protein